MPRETVNFVTKLVGKTAREKNFTCSSLLFGCFPSNFWVPFKSPFSFEMKLTLRIVFVWGLQSKHSSSILLSTSQHTSLSLKLTRNKLEKNVVGHLRCFYPSKYYRKQITCCDDSRFPVVLVKDFVPRLATVARVNEKLCCYVGYLMRKASMTWRSNIYYILF